MPYFLRCCALYRTVQWTIDYYDLVALPTLLVWELLQSLGSTWLGVVKINNKTPTFDSARWELTRFYYGRSSDAGRQSEDDERIARDPLAQRRSQSEYPDINQLLPADFTTSPSTSTTWIGTRGN